MIRSVLRSRDLPEELAYTAMIESGFNPLAVSRAGAKGMWQFMAATARQYGLRVDQWIDERLDPEKSTVAAASYLRDLYNMFGSWTLAQAAYNAGEVKVTRAMRATGSSDFWTLARTNHLRTETKEFVPQIHAATMIGLDPSRYGFEFNEPNPMDVDHVMVPPSTDLRRLATTSGVTIETLRSLNPVLVRAITPPGGNWNLRVPVGSRPAVNAALTSKRHAQPESLHSPSRTGKVAGTPQPGLPRRTASGHGGLDRQAVRRVGQRRSEVEPATGAGSDPPRRPATDRRRPPVRRARRTGRLQVRVEVHLFATLVSFMPPETRNGAATLEMPEGSTVRDVAGRLGIPVDLDRVSLVNGQEAEPELPLRSGDVVTVFPPLMGGGPA